MTSAIRLAAAMELAGVSFGLNHGTIGSTAEFADRLIALFALAAGFGKQAPPVGVSLMTLREQRRVGRQLLRLELHFGQQIVPVSLVDRAARRKQVL
jgi:hypothetical protein